MPPFSRLIRFLSQDGRIYYGDPLLPANTTDISQATTARLISGDIFRSPVLTGTTKPISRLLSPLAQNDISSIRCLGLNYAQHAAEASMPIPQYPVLFYKPPAALAGPADDIPIPRIAQECPGVDYECELVIVMGKKCRDVSEKEALEYVLGYAVGNDVSHRGWQLKRGGGQWGIGKGFDGWAPFGPGIVTTEVLGDARDLGIGTKLNGVVVQKSSTRDLIFGVKSAVSWLSKGCTLGPGDLIFTGTPQGVGMGRNPPLWLKHGDMVEVSLEGVGTCQNRVVFEGHTARL
ncbi:fumarylacetoacetate hydrolase [Histoplasma capsulatum var. duboisii H88]|nr:fumarylacetoacetate hydrolase [Histoplasma capsulatum var. duboisii H88]